MTMNDVNNATMSDAVNVATGTWIMNEINSLTYNATPSVVWRETWNALDWATYTLVGFTFAPHVEILEALKKDMDDEGFS